MTVTDDDVKTRGQKDKLEEITAPPPTEQKQEEGMASKKPEPPKLPRDGTMVVTAKVISIIRLVHHIMTHSPGISFVCISEIPDSLLRRECRVLSQCSSMSC